MAHDGTTGDQLRAASALGASHNEDTMYAAIKDAIDELLPSGFQFVIRAKDERDFGKPDLSLSDKAGGRVACLEVKHFKTLKDAFKVTAAQPEHQVATYRRTGLPVVLTDATHWYDVTDLPDLTSFDSPLVDFTHAASDDASTASLRDWLHAICGRRPQHTIESAISSVRGVINQINRTDHRLLADGWAAVRQGLGLKIDKNSLDSAGIGEAVAFALLAIATELPDLQPDKFVDEAKAEWVNEFDHWTVAGLPGLMAATLRAFRDEDRQSAILDASGWVSLRSVAAWVRNASARDRWSRLSNLWDGYLAKDGRRKTLGSWQTPTAVAAYQAAEVDKAMQSLGYSGLHDRHATIVDPCCGTGVYLDAVVSHTVAAGHSSVGFNGDGANGVQPRLIGADISSTAVAATHIRLAAVDVRPSLFTADTLAADPGGAALNLFGSALVRQNPIVQAARADLETFAAWAAREDDLKPPVIAIIGNPPYLHSALKGNRYATTGWRTDVLEHWKKGSGGRGPLQDLFVAFWAWAIKVCSGTHDGITADQNPAGQLLPADGGQGALLGVVSFITNRTWLDGSSFGPMRAWISARAATIQITDFGPGTRGGAANGWSTQPFAIQTGTAIVTLTFNPDTTKATTAEYRRAAWKRSSDGFGIEIIDNTPIDLLSSAQESERRTATWCLTTAHRSLTSGVSTVNGIKTGDNDKWIRVTGNAAFATRHAYRAFDNRYSPTSPPPKAHVGSEPKPNESSEFARWNEKGLFLPHSSHVGGGGWYAIMQSKSAKPGPAIHATRHLPDYDAFKGSEGGKVVRVGPGCTVPTDYRRGQ
jgi:hypothetical protein